MTTLTDDIKRMLNALAFADAGENLMLSQKSRILGKGAMTETHPQIAVKAGPTAARKQVALYMGSELPADIMNYVVQTCARLNHGLTVLTFQSDSIARALLSPYTNTLETSDIAMQLTVLTGDPVSGLARYLRRHPEVAFLACNETGYLGRSFMNGTQRQDALPVPVVMVATQQDNVQHGNNALPSEHTVSVRAA